MKKREKLVPYLFLFPAMLVLIIFKLFPIINAAFTSFHESTLGGGSTWAGLSNYLFLFRDATFWKSFGVTLKWSAIINPFQIISALALAIFVNKQIKWIGFFRTIYFMPIVISLGVTSLIWGLMLNPNSGIINSMLCSVFKIPLQPFLTSSKQALWVIIIFASWRSIGYWMIFFLAGLQAISPELYEAAKIDGATKGKIFRYITMPLLKRTIAFVVVADTCANFLIFSPVFILTKGGPQMSTNVMMYEAYKNAFLYSDHGLSSAIVMIIIFVMLLLVGVEMRIFRTDY